MSLIKMFKLILFIVLIIYAFNVNALENCKWNNQKGIPCITISKTPNKLII